MKSKELVPRFLSTKPPWNGYTNRGTSPSRGLRIGYRRRELHHSDARSRTEPAFAGFAAFLDPPKKSAAPVLKALAESGVSIKVVTGDNW